MPAGSAKPSLYVGYARRLQYDFDLAQTMRTFTGAIGTGSKWLLDRIVSALAATGINPNLLTLLGLLVNFGAAACFAVGTFRTGAILIFIAGFLDMLDGQVAR